MEVCTEKNLLATSWEVFLPASSMERIAINKYFYSGSFQISSVVGYISNGFGRYINYY